MAVIDFSEELDAKQPTWLGNADDVTWKIQCSIMFGEIGPCYILKRYGDDGTFHAVSQATSLEAAKENAQHLHEEHLQYNPLYHEVRDDLHKSGLTGITIQKIEHTHNSMRGGTSHFSSANENRVALELRRKLDQVEC